MNTNIETQKPISAHNFQAFKQEGEDEEFAKAQAAKKADDLSAATKKLSVKDGGADSCDSKDSVSADLLLAK